MAPAVHKALRDRGQTFSKVFRWRLPDGQTQAPATVEIAGSFTHWQKMPLTRGNALDGWQATLHHIPGNRTHHYMLLADGKPVPDENADGMAIPHGPQEEQFQLMTPRGGRAMSDRAAAGPRRTQPRSTATRTALRVFGQHALEMRPTRRPGGILLCAEPLRTLLCPRLVRWCNGSTRPFGGLCPGSNPGRTAKWQEDHPRRSLYCREAA